MAKPRTLKRETFVREISQLLDEAETTIAVVGATDDSFKYGHLIYRDLKAKKFCVYPVNPNRLTVDGDKTFEHIGAIPESPTIVNILVPPKVTLNILQQCLDLGLMNVWLQPGAESPEVMVFLQQHSFNYLANTCIMVASRSKI